MRFISILFLLLQTVSSVAGDSPKYERKVVDQWWQAIHTLADAKAIRTTVEAYAIDHQRFPPAKNMEELRKLVEPIYVRTLPMTDAWGTPFEYRVSEDGHSYTIASAGSDRKFDESTWKDAGYTMSSKDDLVYHENQQREWVIQERCQ